MNFPSVRRSKITSSVQERPQTEKFVAVHAAALRMGTCLDFTSSSDFPVGAYFKTLGHAGRCVVAWPDHSDLEIAQPSFSTLLMQEIHE